MNTNSRHRHIDYQTDDGLDLRLYPVRLVLIELAVQSVKDELRAQGVVVDPPTYRLESPATGISEEIEHVYDPENGLDSLTDPSDPKMTAWNFAQWRKYQTGLARVAQAEEDRRIQEFFKQGVEFEWPDGIKGWENEVRAITRGQVDPPADDGTPETEAQRKWMWLWYCHLSAFDTGAIRNALTLLAQGRILAEASFLQITEELRSSMAERVRETLKSAITSTATDAERERPAEVVPDA